MQTNNQMAVAVNLADNTHAEYPKNGKNAADFLSIIMGKGGSTRSAMEENNEEANVAFTSVTMADQASNAAAIDKVSQVKLDKSAPEIVNQIISGRGNNVTQHIANGSLQVAKELYEQTAFALGKLSYIESTAGLASRGNPIARSSINTEYSILSPEAGSGSNGVAGYSISNQPSFTIKIAKEAEKIQSVEKEVALKSSWLSTGRHIIEKRNVLVSGKSDEVTLYLRDHFSSQRDLRLSVSTILNHIKQHIVKIFINGKGR